MNKSSCLVLSLAVFACSACGERDALPRDEPAAAVNESVEPPVEGSGDAISLAKAIDDKAALEEAAAYAAQLHEESVRAVEEEALVAAIQAQVEQQDRGSPPAPTASAVSGSPSTPSTPQTEEEALIAAIQAQVEQQQASGKENPPPAD